MAPPRASRARTFLLPKRAPRISRARHGLPHRARPPFAGPTLATALRRTWPHLIAPPPHPRRAAPPHCCAASRILFWPAVQRALSDHAHHCGSCVSAAAIFIPACAVARAHCCPADVTTWAPRCVFRELASSRVRRHAGIGFAKLMHRRGCLASRPRSVVPAPRHTRSARAGETATVTDAPGTRPVPEARQMRGRGRRGWIGRARALDRACESSRGALRLRACEGWVRVWAAGAIGPCSAIAAGPGAAHESVGRDSGAPREANPGQHDANRGWREA